MKKRLIHLFLTGVVLAALLSGCGKTWVCDRCDKEFTGDAYYGFTGTETYCEDCARKFWSPFPYRNYVK